MMNQVTSFTGKYAFLSNFFPVQLITVHGLPAGSVEHAYQSDKMLNTDDRIKAVIAPSAAAAKRYGQSHQMRPDWELIKDERMLYYIRQKFQIHALRLMLVATDTMDLIEGNTWGDQYWGAIWTPQGWKGKNKCGQILMQVRRECGVTL